jgi:hypothetical protein
MATFENALTHLRADECVRRSSWDESLSWIKLDMGDPEIEGDPDNIILKTTTETEPRPWIPSSRDIIAADWEVVTP